MASTNNVQHEHHKMSQEEKEQIAQEKFGRGYDELETDQKKAVGGQFRANEMGHDGYSDMGKMGAKKGGYSTGYAHDPEEAAKYTDQVNAGFAPEDSLKPRSQG